MRLTAGKKLLPRKIGEAIGTDAASVAGPVFLTCGDLLTTQRAAENVPPRAAMGVVQNGYLLVCI